MCLENFQVLCIMIPSLSPSPKPLLGALLVKFAYGEVTQYSSTKAGLIRSLITWRALNIFQYMAIIE
jgi:hypothetical protein